MYVESLKNEQKSPFYIAEFEKFNCRINGLTEVKTGWKLMDGSQETISALKMEITNE